MFEVVLVQPEVESAVIFNQILVLNKSWRDRLFGASVYSPAINGYYLDAGLQGLSCPHHPLCESFRSREGVSFAAALMRWR